MANNLLSRFRGKAEISRAASLTLNQYLQQLVDSRLGYGYTQPYVQYGVDGRPVERTPASFEQYARDIYAAHPVIFGLMEARRSVFSEARFCWRAVRNGNPGDVLPISDGLELLNAPWPGAQTGTLISRMRQDADLGGTAFVVREDGFGDRPSRLRRLRPDWVQIVLSGNPWEDLKVDFLGIVYAPNGPDNSPVETYLAEEVCLFAPIPDPLAQFRGMSWLTPVLREIEADNAATSHRKSTLERGAWLGPIVSAPQGTSLDQFKKFVEAADSAHAGPNNAGRMVFLAPGSEIKTVAQSLRDLDMKAISGSVETRIAAASRVPAVIAQISEGLQGSSLNTGNYTAAKRQWIDGSLRPDWRSLCEALSVITPAPDLSGLGLPEGTTAQLWILESDIALLHEDRLEAAQVRTANATTINTLVTAGFVPDTIVQAVRDDDLSALKHSGAYSVQLQPPGANMDADGASTEGPDGAEADGEPADPEGDEEYQQALEELRAGAGEARRSQILRARVAHKGAMVALVPAVEDAERLVIGDGEPLDELHLTLFYLGDAADIPAKTQAAIREAVASMVERRRLPAVLGNVFGAALWNPTGAEPAAVLSVGDPKDMPGGLAKVRALVENAIAAAGFEPPEQHSPWAPHVCLRYGAPLSATAVASRVGPVTFDRLRIAFGGTVMDVPLAEVQRAATHPGPYRYRHGWIPVSPLASLSLEDVESEFGRELDRFEFNDGECRIVAREKGVTVESDRGADVAVHSTPSAAEAERWADAIESGENYDRPRFSVLRDVDGATVRFGDYETELDDGELADTAQALRDMSYVAEDAQDVPDDEFVQEPEGDESPILDEESQRSPAAALRRFRDGLERARVPRDGDGDGFIDDGKPTMRPAPRVPGRPLAKAAKKAPTRKSTTPAAAANPAPAKAGGRTIPPAPLPKRQMTPAEQKLADDYAAGRISKAQLREALTGRRPAQPAASQDDDAQAATRAFARGLVMAGDAVAIAETGDSDRLRRFLARQNLTDLANMARMFGVHTMPKGSKADVVQALTVLVMAKDGPDGAEVLPPPKSARKPAAEVSSGTARLWAQVQRFTSPDARRAYLESMPGSLPEMAKAAGVSLPDDVARTLRGSAPAVPGKDASEAQRTAWKSYNAARDVAVAAISARAVGGDGDAAGGVPGRRGGPVGPAARPDVRPGSGRGAGRVAGEAERVAAGSGTAAGRVGGSDAGDLTGARGLSTDPAVRAVQIENRIRQAFLDLRERTDLGRPIAHGAGVSTSNRIVALADLRGHQLLQSAPRSEQDAVLRTLARDQEWRLNPTDVRWLLSNRDHAAGVRIGADDVYSIQYVGPRADGEGTPSLRPLPGSSKPAKKATKAAPSASAEWRDWTPAQHRARALELQQQGDNAEARRHRSLAQWKARQLAESGEAVTHLRGLTDRDEARSFLRALLRGQLDDVARQLGVSTEGTRDAVIARILAVLFGRG